MCRMYDTTQAQNTEVRMRRSTALSLAVAKAIENLEAADKIADAKKVLKDLTEALAAYKTRPEGEPEVKEAEAKAKAKA